MSKFPVIVNRTRHVLSKWATVIDRDVMFFSGDAVHRYHSFDQLDYVSILAVNDDGLFPVVRQYRPSIEGFSWELPAGMVDSGDSPEQTCVRELQEETGLIARQVITLGSYRPCTARLSNFIHAYFVVAEGRAVSPLPEENIEARLVSYIELKRMAVSGEMVLMPHVGTLFLAEANEEARRYLC